MSEVPLKIVSFNIAAGQPDKTMGKVVDIIRKADIALLQEVDKNTLRSSPMYPAPPYVDQADVLAKVSGLNYYAYGASFDYQFGYSGNAILSRYPLDYSTNYMIPKTSPTTKTSILQVGARVQGSLLHLFCSHFAYDSEPDRIQGANFLLELIANIQDPLIFGGDLNAEPDSSVVKLISSKLKSCYDLAPSPKNHCGPRVDHVFFNSQFNVQRYEAPCLEEPAPSDHPPVYVDLLYYPKPSPDPIPNACKPIEAEVESLQNEIKRLQDELQGAPTSEKGRINAEIRELNKMKSRKEQELIQCIEEHRSN
jgi:endonuclease/exonuclease/phosphatase family metal-dependent hydrolase